MANGRKWTAEEIDKIRRDGFGSKCPIDGADIIFSEQQIAGTDRIIECARCLKCGNDEALNQKQKQ